MLLRRCVPSAVVPLALALALLAAAPVGAAAPPKPSPPLETVVNGQSVTDGRAVIVNGVILFPLYVLAERLGLSASWLEETRTVRLEAFGKVVYLPLDQKVALVDGRSFKLAEPAHAFEGRTFVPLRFLAEILQFEVRYTGSKRRVEVRAPEYFLTDIRYSLADGRPRLVFSGTRPPKPQVTLKQNPLRLVLDFRARLSLPAGALPTGDPLVREVSWKQERLDLARVTVALERDMPYALETISDRLEVVFPPQVRSAGLVVDGGRRMLTVNSTSPLQARIHRLPDPDRLVIDLPGAVLAAPSRIPLADDWVEGVRLGQLDAQTVRVVADLRGPLAWKEEGLPAPDPGPGLDGGWVFRLHLLNRVTQLSFQSFRDRTQLRLQLAVPALPTVVVDRRTGRLEIDLAEAVADGLPAELPVDDGTVDRVSLLADDSGTVRWAVSLPYYVGHQVIPGKPGEAVVEISRSPVYRTRIFLDPGHGGADAGAIGPNGVLEKEVNLDIALRLREALREAGAEVFLSREADVFIPLYDRPRNANDLGAAVFVSIHANANPKTGESGTETYYHPDRRESKELAQAVQKKLVDILKLNDRSIRPTREFVVTREANMPAVLAEVAFLSNPGEERLLGDAGFRQKAAEALAEGIMAHFRERLENGR